MNPDDTRNRCFHCGEPLGPGARFEVTIRQQPRPMCCPGCQAVAQAIVEQGLDAFYDHRTDTNLSQKSLLPPALSDTRVYDHPAIQRQFVAAHGATAEATLILEEIRCPACLWLNEKTIAALDGVVDVNINYTTQRAHVRWLPEHIKLSDILTAIQAIGYQAHPFSPQRQTEVLEQERHTLIKRLGVALLLGMQIMVLSVALYGGDWWGIEPQYRQFFERVMLLLSLPILLYSARPFFSSALADLRNRRIGMDIPIALGLSIAFIASLLALVSGAGHVYFDSIAMFVSFLLIARFLELGVRRRSQAAASRLLQDAPATALLLTTADQSPTRVPVAVLEVGQQVLVHPGATIPADGIIVAGSSAVDEALLTGEHQPVTKSAGDTVIGGSVNTDQALTIRVTAVGPGSVLHSLLRLLDRAQAERPAQESIANRIAGHFVAGVLLIAAASAGYWYLHEPQRWLIITLSVLVIACPCALSLATPAAFASASARLFGRGLLITRGNTLERLRHVDHVVFDKTGTLTHGTFQIERVHAPDIGEARARQVAGALEQFSSHPLARAFAPDQLDAGGVEAIAGQGLVGTVDGEQYLFGNLALMRGNDIEVTTALADIPQGLTRLYLASSHAGLVACFDLADKTRSGAAETVGYLLRQHYAVSMLTGDNANAAQALAAQIGIDKVMHSASPAQKLDFIRARQAQGETVLMVGDGVNDAAVLAGADVSIAMGSAAPLAASGADAIMVSNQLLLLPDALETARRTARVVRQNLAWAAAYNLLALPAAVFGAVAPWLAALGMSLSSLLVVLNALRLSR